MTIEEIKIKAYNDCVQDKEPEELNDVSDGFLYLQMYGIYKMYSVQAVSRRKAEQLTEIAVRNYNKFALHQKMYHENKEQILQKTLCHKCGAVVYNQVLTWNM